MFHHYGYKSFARRLSRVESKLLRQFAREDAAIIRDRMFVPNREINELISRLPPQKRTNAQRIVNLANEYYAHLRSAGPNRKEKREFPEAVVLNRYYLGTYLSMGNAPDFVAKHSDEYLKVAWTNISKLVSGPVGSELAKLANNMRMEFILRGIDAPAWQEEEIGKAKVESSSSETKKEFSMKLGKWLFRELDELEDE